MKNELSAEDSGSRLARLETQFLMLKFAFLATLVSLLAIFLVGMKGPEEEQRLSAKEFVLVDDGGKTRARLYFDTTENGPQLVFYNSDSKPALQLALKEESSGGIGGRLEQRTSLTFLDKETNALVALDSSRGVNSLKFNSQELQQELLLESGLNWSNIEMGGFVTQTKAIPIVIKTTPKQAEISMYEHFHVSLRGLPKGGVQPRIRLRQLRHEGVEVPEIAIYEKITTAAQLKETPEIFCAGSLCATQ